MNNIKKLEQLNLSLQQRNKLKDIVDKDQIFVEINQKFEQVNQKFEQIDNKIKNLNYYTKSEIDNMIGKLETELANI